MRTSNEHVQALRIKCVNNFHLATEIYQQRWSRTLLLGICECVRPIEERHSIDISTMKTQSGRLRWNVQMASGENLEYIVQTHNIFTNQDLLLNMGLVACGGHVSEALMPPTMAQDVLDALFTFWRSLAALEIAFARSYSECMPAMAFTQLAYDAPVRRQGMENMKQLWERLQKAEAQMPEYPFLYDFLHRLDWPVNLWCRELLLTAAECNFTVLPENILQELQDASRGVSSTKTVEDSFNYLRAQSEPVRNGKQGPLQIWHALHTSSILEDADLCPVQANHADEASAGKMLPRAMFKAIAGAAHCSLPSSVQQDFQCDASHSNVSALRHLHLATHTRMFLDSPSTVSLHKGWMNLLCVEGSVLHGGSVDECIAGYVMESTEAGCLLWTGDPMGIHDYRFFEFNLSSEKPWRQVNIWDHRDWSLMRVSPRTPAAVNAQCGLNPKDHDALQRITFQLLPRKRHRLLEVAAEHGFKHHNLAQLRAMWAYLRVPVIGRKPMLLADVLVALIRHVLGPLTDDEIAAILAQRESKPGNHFDSVVHDNPDVLTEALHEKDAETCQKDAGHVPAANKRDPEAKAQLAGDKPGSSTDGEQAPKPRPKGAPVNLEHCTQEQATALLPKTKGCFISPVLNRRWQVKYLQRPGVPRSHTVTYYDEPGQCKEHVAALKRCLMWAWDIHTNECGGEPCPWDLVA